MNLDEIRELIDLMKENDLAEIDFESEGHRIRIKAAQPPMPQHPHQALLPHPHTSPAPVVEFFGHPDLPAQPASPPSPDQPEPEESGELITSPIVGIFYAAASPDKPVFVHEGDLIDENTIVCIIEAMKVMNEIKAEIAGTVRGVLVNNGQPVEYGQPLFLVEPHA